MGNALFRWQGYCKFWIFHHLPWFFNLIKIGGRWSCWSLVLCFLTWAVMLMILIHLWTFLYQTMNRKEHFCEVIFLFTSTLFAHFPQFKSYPFLTPAVHAITLGSYAWGHVLTTPHMDLDHLSFSHCN